MLTVSNQRNQIIADTITNTDFVKDPKAVNGIIELIQFNRDQNADEFLESYRILKTEYPIIKELGHRRSGFFGLSALWYSLKNDERRSVRYSQIVAQLQVGINSISGESYFAANRAGQKALCQSINLLLVEMYSNRYTAKNSPIRIKDYLVFKQLRGFLNNQDQKNSFNSSFKSIQSYKDDDSDILFEFLACCPEFGAVISDDGIVGDLKNSVNINGKLCTQILREFYNELQLKQGASLFANSKITSMFGKRIKLWFFIKKWFHEIENTSNLISLITYINKFNNLGASIANEEGEKFHPRCTLTAKKIKLTIGDQTQEYRYHPAIKPLELAHLLLTAFKDQQLQDAIEQAFAVGIRNDFTEIRAQVNDEYSVLRKQLNSLNQSLNQVKKNLETYGNIDEAACNQQHRYPNQEHLLRMREQKLHFEVESLQKRYNCLPLILFTLELYESLWTEKICDNIMKIYKQVQETKIWQQDTPNIKKLLDLYNEYSSATASSDRLKLKLFDSRQYIISKNTQKNDELLLAWKQPVRITISETPKYIEILTKIQEQTTPYDDSRLTNALFQATPYRMNNITSDELALLIRVKFKKNIVIEKAIISSVKNFQNKLKEARDLYSYHKMNCLAENIQNAISSKPVIKINNNSSQLMALHELAQLLASQIIMHANNFSDLVNFQFRDLYNCPLNVVSGK